MVIGSSPRLVAVLTGERLARWWGETFVLEVCDLWPESLVAVGGVKGHRQRMVVYIPNGVDQDAIASIERPAGETFTHVYAGAHGRENGLDTVLDVAEILRSQEDIQFILVGDGSVNMELAAGTRARGVSDIEFRDPVPKSRMVEVFAAAGARLMVLKNAPLFAVGVSPNKLFDYFGASLQAVCKVPGEVESIVVAARCGVLAQPGSGKSLANAIVDLAGRSFKERVEMGHSARARVTWEHCRAVLADRLDGMLREWVVL